MHRWNLYVLALIKQRRYVGIRIEVISDINACLRCLPFASQVEWWFPLMTVNESLTGAEDVSWSSSSVEEREAEWTSRLTASGTTVSVCMTGTASIGIGSLSGIVLQQISTVFWKPVLYLPFVEIPFRQQLLKNKRHSFSPFFCRAEKKEERWEKPAISFD